MTTLSPGFAAPGTSPIKIGEAARHALLPTRPSPPPGALPTGLYRVPAAVVPPSRARSHANAPSSKPDAPAYLLVVTPGAHITLGRAPSACKPASAEVADASLSVALPPDARHVSRAHAVVEWTGLGSKAQWVVRVLGQNGLLIDGIRRRANSSHRLALGELELPLDQAARLFDQLDVEADYGFQPAALADSKSHLTMPAATELDFFGIRIYVVEHRVMDPAPTRAAPGAAATDAQNVTASTPHQQQDKSSSADVSDAAMALAPASDNEATESEDEETRRVARVRFTIPTQQQDLSPPADEQQVPMRASSPLREADPRSDATLVPSSDAFEPSPKIQKVLRAVPEVQEVRDLELDTESEATPRPLRRGAGRNSSSPPYSARGSSPGNAHALRSSPPLDLGMPSSPPTFARASLSVEREADASFNLLISSPPCPERRHDQLFPIESDTEMDMDDTVLIPTPLAARARSQEPDLGPISDLPKAELAAAAIGPTSSPALSPTEAHPVAQPTVNCPPAVEQAHLPVPPVGAPAGPEPAPTDSAPSPAPKPDVVEKHPDEVVRQPDAEAEAEAEPRPAGLKPSRSEETQDVGPQGGSGTKPQRKPATLLKLTFRSKVPAVTLTTKTVAKRPVPALAQPDQAAQPASKRREVGIPTPPVAKQPTKPAAVPVSKPPAKQAERPSAKALESDTPATVRETKPSTKRSSPTVRETGKKRAGQEESKSSGESEGERKAAKRGRTSRSRRPTRGVAKEAAAPPSPEAESKELLARDQAREAVRSLAPTYDLPGLLAGVVVFHRTATMAGGEACRQVLAGTAGLLQGEAGERAAEAGMKQGEVHPLWDLPGAEGMSAARKSLIQRKAWTEYLTMLLQSLPLFGAIERAGKDAAGNALEPWYYYNPEQDEDEERAATLRAFVKPIRGALKTLKPIVWKKSMYGRSGSTTVGASSHAPGSAIWDETQPEERERTWDRIGDQDFVA